MAQKRNTQMQRFLLRFFTPVNAQTAHASSDSSVSASDNCFNTYFINRQMAGRLWSLFTSRLSIYSTRYMLRTSSPSLPRPLSSESRVIFKRKEYHTITMQEQTREFSRSFIPGRMHFFAVVATESASVPVGYVIVSFAVFLYR